MSTYESETGRLPPQSLLRQRYLIVGRAGKGGMGAIYQALDVRDGNRRVAIKELSQGHLSNSELGEATAQFQREAEMLHNLRHPNLPRIYDAFNERGRSYLVMDFIDGKTLFQLLKEMGYRPLPAGQVVYYAQQLCDVLAYLHQQQPPIIFRDLKPTNVMVTADGRVFLIDFGIARIFKEGQEQDTTLLGSPGYAPPEQHGSAQTSPRSDLYSLGATLHFCLTGKDPYHADYHFIFPPVRQFNPQVPVDLDQLIRRLLAQDERQRPASASEVKQALNRISQETSGPTQAVSPASAPTQYVQYASPAPALAATQYAQPNPSSSQGPMLLPPTSPVPPPASLSGVGALQAAPQKVERSSSFARLWTPPFIILFGLLLVLTIGGSTYAFNAFTGSDHLVESALSVLLFFVAAGTSALARGVIPKILLLLSGLAALLAGLAFALLAEPSLRQTIDPRPTSPLQFEIPNLVFTGGLAAAAIISLFWLTRPFSMLDRIMLLVMFGAAIVCVLLQFPSSDGDTSKHILLLIALIVLILGVPLAAQMERARDASMRT